MRTESIGAAGYLVSIEDLLTSLDPAPGIVAAGRGGSD